MSFIRRNRRYYSNRDKDPNGVDLSQPQGCKVRCDGKLHGILFLKGQLILIEHHKQVMKDFDAMACAKIMDDPGRYGCARVLIAWNRVLGKGTSKRLVSQAKHFFTYKDLGCDPDNLAASYAEQGAYNTLPKQLQSVVDALKNKYHGRVGRYLPHPSPYKAGNLKKLDHADLERVRTNDRDRKKEAWKDLMRSQLLLGVSRTNYSKEGKEYLSNIHDRYGTPNITLTLHNHNIELDPSWLHTVCKQRYLTYEGCLVHKIYTTDTGSDFNAVEVIVETSPTRFELRLKQFRPKDYYRVY